MVFMPSHPPVLDGDRSSPSTAAAASLIAAAAPSSARTLSAPKANVSSASVSGARPTRQPPGGGACRGDLLIGRSGWPDGSPW